MKTLRPMDPSRNSNLLIRWIRFNVLVRKTTFQELQSVAGLYPGSSDGRNLREEINNWKPSC